MDLQIFNEFFAIFVTMFAKKCLVCTQWQGTDPLTDIDYHVFLITFLEYNIATFDLEIEVTDTQIML